MHLNHYRTIGLICGQTAADSDMVKVLKGSGRVTSFVCLNIFFTVRRTV